MRFLSIENRFFKKILSNIDHRHIYNKSTSIINLLRKHPKFSADKSEFVKYLAYILCEDDPDLCVFYADGDNLRIANEIADIKASIINHDAVQKLNLPDESFLSHPITGEKLVDYDIESIIKQLKSILFKYGYNNSLVGVQGDEFFIVVPHLKYDDLLNIYEEFSNTRSGLINISVGYCNDMSNGIEQAFSIAEKAANTVKVIKKKKTAEHAFGHNAISVINEELQKMLNQLRINVDSLTNDEKQILSNNISSSFQKSLRSFEGLANDVKNLLTNIEEEDSIKQRIKKLDELLGKKHYKNVNKLQRNNYILAHILSYTPVDGIPKYEYFFHKYVPIFIPKNKTKAFNELSNNTLITFELSGIKDINDTFGHTKCDKLVYETVKNIKDLLSSLDVKTKTPIFSHNISTYSFIVSNEALENFSQIEQAISNIPSDFKIAISQTQMGIDIPESILKSYFEDNGKTSLDIFTLLFNFSFDINKKMNFQKNSLKKINDETAIARYIAKNINSILQIVSKTLTPEIIDGAISEVLKIDFSIQTNTETKTPTIDFLEK